MAKKLNILIADDSPTARLMLSNLVNNAGDMRVVGTAANGLQALEMVQKFRPDVVIMDMTMPEMDGLEATREIMHHIPTPIVVVSAGVDGAENDFAFQAISAGALTVLQKPHGYQDIRHAGQVDELLKTIRTMADVHVIHHWKRTEKPDVSTNFSRTTKPRKCPELVAMVASTGGPAALSTILQELPANFALPVVIVQHIAPDFVSSLCGWLNSISKLPVDVARHGERPQPGQVYLSPGDLHLYFTHDRCFMLDKTPRGTQHMPSGDVLFQSVASSYGDSAVGVLLTGMGIDGAQGLREMYRTGAFTIAQDEATCVVYGMPREAAAMGAARLILPLPNIANTLISLSKIREENYEEKPTYPDCRR
jgi:two-component system, chemotaxis family, protein-glutamate methylesterase/glutaminase